MSALSRQPRSKALGGEPEIAPQNFMTRTYISYARQNQASTYEEIVRKQFPSDVAHAIIKRHRQAKHGVPYYYCDGVSPEYLRI